MVVCDGVDSKIVWVETEPGPSAERDSRRNRRPFAFGFRDSDRVVLGRGLETSPDKRSDVVQKTLWLVGVVAMLLLMAFVSVVEFLLAEHVSREDEQHVRIAVGAAPMDLFGRALAVLRSAGTLVVGPALACLALVCILLTRFLMGQLARRHTISALVDGSVAGANGS